MKEILKNVKMNFKLNSTVFILASVIYLFLLVIGLSLTIIFPFSDVLTVIFIISPFIFNYYLDFNNEMNFNFECIIKSNLGKIIVGLLKRSK